MNKEEKMKNNNNNVNKDQEINKKRKKNNNNNNQDCNLVLTPPTRFPSDFGDNEKLNDSLALSLNSHYQSWPRRVPPPQEVAVDPPLPLSPPPQEAPPLPPQQQLFMKPPQEAPPLPLSPPPLPPHQQLFMRLPQEAPPLPPQQLFMRPPQEAPPLPHPQPRPTSQPLFMQSLLAHNPSPLPLQLSSSHPLNMQTQAAAAGELPTSPPPSTAYRPPRARRNPTQAPRGGKSDTVPAPFPWATTRRATVHSLDYLLSREMYTITGDVQCKRCEKHYEMELDLKEKFMEVGRFIAENKSAMHDRAPGVWMNPALPACKYCEQENMVKPVIAEKKKSINWLFLLLGQMLGCCTLEQLKYFCKHTKNHRTGAKDRVLYLTYLALCKQLDPKGPFER